MKYEIECVSCGNIFELDIDPAVMDEYLMRLNGVWGKCSDGTQKCWRPVNIVLKDLDDRTKFILENAMCEKCLNASCG